MRLEKVRVYNFTSIIDSGDVELDPKITALVGLTGAGKTSFLEMISGIDEEKVFHENELPHGSELQQKFLNGDIPSSEIIQLSATYSIDDSDRDILPEEFKKISGIEFKRYFDGHRELIPLGEYEPISIDIQDNVTAFNTIIDTLKTNFKAAKARIPQLAQHEQNFITSTDEFKETDFKNIKEVELSSKTLINFINGLQKDGNFQNEINQRIVELNNTKNGLTEKIKDIPNNKLYEVLPKPLFIDDVFDLEDKVSIDEFIADPGKSDTFNSIAIIGGLKQSGLQKIRNTDSASQNSYLDMISNKVSNQLNKFWTQEKYSFKLRIQGPDLLFTVIDETTGKETSVLERSTGFQWWMAFFLEISTFLTEGYGMNILLLDGPATDLHDEGRGDVLRFLTTAVESGKLQIIYTTHERALIDPWRLDRIRLVEKKRSGTIIEQVKSDAKADILNKIRKNIGSPARYSLFGAPRTIAFEGISDIVFFSTFNEYLEQKGSKFLHKDSYSINAFNGINKAPEFCDLNKNLGLEFVLVVDSGSKTREMQKSLKGDDFNKYFIEIKEFSGKDESDIEDMIEPELYHFAFTKAYEKILDVVPSLGEINSQGEDQKTVTKYKNWFKSKNMEGKFNKPFVAYQMIKILMQDRDPGIPEGPLKKTEEKFAKLISSIKNTFN